MCWFHRQIYSGPIIRREQCSLFFFFHLFLPSLQCASDRLSTEHTCVQKVITRKHLVIFLPMLCNDYNKQMKERTYPTTIFNCIVRRESLG